LFLEHSIENQIKKHTSMRLITDGGNQSTGFQIVFCNSTSHQMKIPAELDKKTKYLIINIGEASVGID
jgi:hypothetical protein